MPKLSEHHLTDVERHYDTQTVTARCAGCTWTTTRSKHRGGWMTTVHLLRRDLHEHHHEMSEES